MSRYNIQGISQKRIKIGKKITSSFNTTKIYLDRALVKWEKNISLRIGDDILFTLLFADDQIVIAEDEEDFNYMIRKLKEEYEIAGLQMNFSKYLIVGNEEINDLILDTDTIKAGVKYSKYLGTIFNKNRNSENEIQERINKGRTVIRTINYFLLNKKNKKNHKETGNHKRYEDG